MSKVWHIWGKTAVGNFIEGHETAPSKSEAWKKFLKRHPGIRKDSIRRAPYFDSDISVIKRKVKAMILKRKRKKARGKK